MNLKTFLPLALLSTLVSGENLFNIDTTSVISNECCDLSYADLNTLNQKIRPLVSKLVQEDYFKHIQFKLEMDCPFFECQSICFSPGCQLDLDVHSQAYDYDRLNNVNKLGDINEDSFLDSLCPKANDVYDDEWCDLNDKDGVIIDISRNPERFTGYIPTPEQNIWGMIYQHHLEGECPIEQKVFYQIISGFHSSVSTHLSNEWYNNETNSWGPNLELFEFKVGSHPDRIQNIYFDYALLMRSILKISHLLDKETKYNPLNSANDRLVHNEVMEIVRNLPTDSSIFNEDIMFQNREIKEDFKQKFKNVTKLMDCVTCDRCRLWGKVQSTGYATALKILFDDPSTLSKNEISALFNTFDRLTKSIASINNFNYLKLQKEQELAQTQEARYIYDEEEILQSNNQDQIVDITKDEFKDDTSPVIKGNPLREIEQKSKSLGDAFQEELDNVKDALKFIFNSYINLPANLKNIFLYKFNQWWNSFIGVKNYNDEQSYLHNIIA